VSWTTPTNVTTGQIVTAAYWNAQIPSNLLETCPVIASASGDIVYADGANSMGNRLAIGAAGSILVSNGTDPVWRRVSMNAGSGVTYVHTGSSYSDLDTEAP